MRFGVGLSQSGSLLDVCMFCSFVWTPRYCEFDDNDGLQNSLVVAVSISISLLFLRHRRQTVLLLQDKNEHLISSYWWILGYRRSTISTPNPYDSG